MNESLGLLEFIYVGSFMNSFYLVFILILMFDSVRSLSEETNRIITDGTYRTDGRLMLLIGVALLTSKNGRLV